MKMLIVTFLVFLSLAISGCTGTEENPLHFTVDCLDGQLILFYSDNGVTKQVIYNATSVDGIFQSSTELVFSCEKNGDEIVVLNKTTIPFSIIKSN